ncbi:T9SS type A sorting domain-containing protein [Lacinutrix sp.]
MNVSSLSQGSYVLSLESQGRVYTRKFIKQ